MENIHNKSGKCEKNKYLESSARQWGLYRNSGEIIVAARNDEHLSTYSVSFFPCELLEGFHGIALSLIC
jgi:hypothetical protein